MAVSKVTLVNNNVSQTLIDVSNDTAVAADVAQGKTFHLATGEQAVGTASGQSLPTQTKTVAPSTAQQSVTPDSGYSLAEVVVEAVTSSIDSNIIPSNIRQGVNILGVTGTMQEGSGSNATLLSVVDKSITTITENDFAGLTAIGDGAFYRCAQLTGGTLPSTVTSIGDMAFAGCSSLTSTMLNDNVTHVGLGAYQDCTSLTTLTWTSNFNTIPNTCFSNTGFTSVTIPEGVTNLEAGCFENCSNLTELTIPSSVTHMEDYCLRNNPNLKVVTVLATTPPSADGVNPLGDYSSLDYVKVPDDAVATYLGESSWNQYNIVGVSTPILPYTSATQFRFDADGYITKYLGSQTKVITPPSYNKVEQTQQFNGVKFHTNNLPDLFPNTGLTFTLSYSEDGSNPQTYTSDNLSGVTRDTYAYLLQVDATSGDYTNMQSLVNIGVQEYPVCVNNTVCFTEDAWHNYWNGGGTLNTAQVFNGTGNVITFEDGDNIAVTQIDEDAFLDSNGMPSTITQLEISEGVTGMDTNFEENTSIQKVKFPSTLTNLGVMSFTGCTSLNTVEIAPGNSTIVIDNNIVYKVDSATGLRTLLFALCGYSGTISLLNTVAEISSKAFASTSYDTIQINNVGSVTPLTLGGNLFSNSMVQNITFTNLTDTITINPSTFSDANNLTSLTLPPCGGGSLNLTNLSSLSSLDISRSGITDLSLSNLSSLASITIPASVTSITGQISNCPNLTTITVDATTPPTVQADCFDPSSVSTVYVPQGTVATYQAATGWSTRNIVEQGGTSAVPQAEFHFQENGQEISKTVDLTQYNNTLPTTVDGKQSSTATYIVIRNIQTLTIPSDFKDNQIYYDGTLQQMSDANIIVPNNVVLTMSLLSDKDSETALMKILVTANDGAKIIANAVFPDGTTTGTGSYIDAQGTLVTSGAMKASYELNFSITENGNTTTIVMTTDENNIVTLTVSA